MARYTSDPAWSDINPLPTQEGGPNPLAAIAYSDEYAETMSYLRAVMAANEYSSRVLELTSHLIELNPAHYTVWLYRAQTLFALKRDLKEELQWLNDIAKEHLKNYQIWHHRNLIVDELAKHGFQGEGEREFVEDMLTEFGDGKNYHVWSYRQWLVKRFEMPEDEELRFVERMVGRDQRNNSAWNHRWFVVNGAPNSKGVAHDSRIRDRELDFAKKAIERIPQNSSPWGYLRGVVKYGGMQKKELRGFVERFASVDGTREVKSSHALDFLADLFADEEEREMAGKALDLLAERYDPIRKNYWEYRKGLVGLSSAATA